MHISDETLQPIYMMGIVTVLPVIAMILRSKVRFFRTMLFPAGIIAGVLAFIIVNLNVLPVTTDAFEKLSVHVMGINMMAISFLNIGKPPVPKKSDKSKRGGFHMALVYSGTLSFQAAIAGLLGILLHYTIAPDFNGYFGTIAANGLGGSPSAALAAANIWKSTSLTSGNIVPIALFYSTTGFLIASFVGIPYVKYLIRNGRLSDKVIGKDSSFLRGYYEAEQAPAYGKQTLHRASLDTLALHIFFLLGSYAVVYMLMTTFINRFVASPGTASTLHSIIFIFGVFFAILEAQFLKRTKLERFFDHEILVSLANVCTDVLMITCMAAVSISVLSQYMIPLLTVCIVVTLVSIVLLRIFLKGTGNYANERFLFCFGNCTGTVVSGQMLLRTVDPSFKTIGNELVWFNVFVTLTSVTTTLASFVPLMKLTAYLLINLGAALVMLLLSVPISKSLRKSQSGTTDSAG